MTKGVAGPSRRAVSSRISRARPSSEPSPTTAPSSSPRSDAAAPRTRSATQPQPIVRRSSASVRSTKRRGATPTAMSDESEWRRWSSSHAALSCSLAAVDESRSPSVRATIRTTSAKRAVSARRHGVRARRMLRAMPASSRAPCARWRRRSSSTPSARIVTAANLPRASARGSGAGTTRSPGRGSTGVAVPTVQRAAARAMKPRAAGERQRLRRTSVAGAGGKGSGADGSTGTSTALRSPSDACSDASGWWAASFTPPSPAPRGARRGVPRRRRGARAARTACGRAGRCSR